MERLTRQDLIYAAHALRIAANASEEQAKRPLPSSSKAVFESSAQSQRELAEKFERIAKSRD